MKKLSKILSESLPSGIQNESNKEKQTATGAAFGMHKKRKAHSSDFFDFMSLVEKWGEVVGPGLLDFTHPLKNKNNILTVLVEHPGFAHQLSFLEESIRAKIIKLFPHLAAHLKKINFVTDQNFFKNKQKNGSIISTKMKNVDKVPEQFHPYSPQGQELKRKTQEFLNHLPEEIKGDKELNKTLESLFIQLTVSDDNSVS